MTKYLLEFHRARPTRETLKQSISTGNLELFKMMRERLSKRDLRERLDLMEISAHFHQVEVFRWLCRDATICEREFLWVFALEGKLAVTLLPALEGGFGPWWYSTHEGALNWRASVSIEFVVAPKGFSAVGGWWMSKGGEEGALPPVDRGGGGEWTPGESLKGGTLTCAALPAGVTKIGSSAFGDCSHLTCLRIPSSVTVIGKRAFFGCSGLAQWQMPASMTTIGESAFFGCSGLRQLEIRSGVMQIGATAFWGCSGLRQLKILWGGGC
jgi:hypothetical protein